MTEDEAAVKITLSTIYSKLLDVERKLDPLPDRTEDHEKRLRAIEHQMWRWAGATALASSAAAVAVQKFLGA